MSDVDLFSELLRSWVYVAIAAVGGVLGHMMRRLGTNQRIRIGETILQGVGAAFAGYLVLLGCRSIYAPPEISGVAIGLCGWLGADATLMLLQSYIYKKLNIGKVESRDDNK
ncbi:phage holin family protein [Pseudomonas sp. TH31]|uniref:phage holin family protein n=1 Tax=Pseudomonas sp. TH31 TaxID=2796396 RepID=UPI001914D5C1|nr:phage holin family protein [Pseudomonas sp. TH31]MBK5416163.1 phage holin family protein [Pseudomonas sp. TH31]